MIGYIYCITNNINKKQYVGKTTISVEKRFLEHLRDAKKRDKEERPLYKAINKYGENNFSIEILEQVENGDLSKREEYWIDKLGTYHSGYNATLGGDGKQLFDYEKIVSLIKEGLLTSEIKQIIGCSSDTIYKVAKLNNLTLNTPENDLAKQMKEIKTVVCQYDLENNFIQEFESYADAAKWIYKNNLCKTLNGGVRSHISDAAKGKRKTAYGFIWKNK
jgi:group I intron endonuclease